PALWRAEKIQKKAKKAGFDWDDIDGALEKVREETDEFTQAVQEGSNMEEELGDLLFAAVNAARFAQIDPEVALGKACDKFSARFRRTEELAAGKLDTMKLPEMDKLWEQAKQDLKET
ncbi:MAG: MazG nucleotide pyrophosphohydrolase domain-containing protein, partial [Oscillospiraceae bacterium]